MMVTRGYLRKAENANTLSKNLKRFRRAGVPLSAVTVGGGIMRVIDSLECGDCLVVLSATDLSAQATRQKILLARIAEKGITFRPMDKTKADVQSKNESLLNRLLRRFGLKRPAQEDDAVAPDLQLSAEMQNRVMTCLKPYYQLKKGVRDDLRQSRNQPRHPLSVSPILRPAQPPQGSGAARDQSPAQTGIPRQPAPSTAG